MSERSMATWGPLPSLCVLGMLYTITRYRDTTEKEIGYHGKTSSYKCCNESILPGFQVAGISRRLEVHIWTRPRCQGALEWTNTLRDRCNHISGLLVKTSHGLRALMQSALPRLITTTASQALYLRRLGGSRSDRSCHQLDPTSHRAARLLHLRIKQNSHEKV